MQLAGALDDSLMAVKTDILSNLNNIDSKVNVLQPNTGSHEVVREDVSHTVPASNSGHGKKLKVLYTYDEVGNVANIKELEKLTNCRIDTAAAINSVYDRKMKLPHKNFTDVVTFLLQGPLPLPPASGVATGWMLRP